MRDIAKADSKLVKDIWQREITVDIDDNPYSGTIDTISNDGVFIAFRRAPRLLAGKTIDLLMQGQEQETIKAAKIVWSDEWGFEAKFV